MKSYFAAVFYPSAMTTDNAISEAKLAVENAGHKTGDFSIVEVEDYGDDFKVASVQILLDEQVLGGQLPGDFQ